MQLVLSNNRVIAHGENFLAMGGVVINTETGARYENATVAECEGCPSDIDEVGYEYHAGVFVPCAPYGKGNNNGYFMEVCETCATPRSSGIPVKGGLKLENLNEETKNCFLHLLWENENPNIAFRAQTITLPSGDYDYLVAECLPEERNTDFTSTGIIFNGKKGFVGGVLSTYSVVRFFTTNGNYVSISEACNYVSGADLDNDLFLVPYRIYGAKCV